MARLPTPHTPRRLVETVLTEMIPRPSRRRTELDAAAVFLRRFTLSRQAPPGWPAAVPS